MNHSGPTAGSGCRQDIKSGGPVSGLTPQRSAYGEDSHTQLGGSSSLLDRTVSLAYRLEGRDMEEAPGSAGGANGNHRSRATRSCQPRMTCASKTRKRKWRQGSRSTSVLRFARGRERHWQNSMYSGRCRCVSETLADIQTSEVSRVYDSTN
ncbi:hypothetical protein K437DRAFT_150191 [Tilletiaria anomala UBC 951]|uniref:Uncharacterized protein n=1 Tax=Tilletiaria anomala (strain ATCC 24038 / CBS 436.72 / UBC 951) TaxID=1037660 RepID=A0A066WFZ7_TILAU|nr:uncharacterized protein K437DRAFT_150191 [Tilletiaria anomala UBC 951]KDN52867.1 hypothetical protein K437DRAFT_150191 [Tilletiaria anomala UBC 951]